MPDGGLASFHGGGECDHAALKAILKADDTRAKPFGFAPHSGYHRASAGGATVILDVGEALAERCRQAPMPAHWLSNCARLAAAWSSIAAGMTTSLRPGVKPCARRRPIPRSRSAKLLRRAFCPLAGSEICSDRASQQRRALLRRGAMKRIWAFGLKGPTKAIATRSGFPCDAAYFLQPTGVTYVERMHYSAR